MRSLSTRPSRRDALRRLALLTLALPAAGPGCGYSVRAPFDPKVKTVYVPVVRSLTFRRNIQLELTEMTIKEIEKRTPYKVVGTPDEADTILECTVNFADKNIIVESPFNLPRQLNATVQVMAKWTHNPPLETEKDAQPVLIGDTVNFAIEIGETAETAFYRAAQDVATQIVDMMEHAW
jgi:hypothetical protein